MDHFQRRAGILHAEDVPLGQVAEKFGTPTYVYARQTLVRHAAVLQQSLGDLPHLICYAVKANGSLGILQLLHDAGLGFDAVSVGELLRVQRAGGQLAATIFSGVGKTDAEIAAALRLRVRYISVESLAELVAIGRIAEQMGVVADVSIRLNPDVDAGTHPYISTGLAENKFGVPLEELPKLTALCREHAHLELVGLSCHIGSQITTLAPFAHAAERLAQQVQKLLAQNVALTHVGMGGGLGISYGKESPPSPAAYGAALRRILAPLNLRLVLEPGRVLVGNAGILLTRVVRVKKHGAKTFVLIDAGMNDLLRPALYQAHHEVVPVVATAPQAQAAPPFDLVGPVCESADTFAKNLTLPLPQEGDLLVLRSAGAYGSVMAQTYNGRPKAAEVLADGAQMVLLGRRQSPTELWQLENDLPAALRAAPATTPAGPEEQTPCTNP